MADNLNYHGISLLISPLYTSYSNTNSPHFILTATCLPEVSDRRQLGVDGSAIEPAVVQVLYTLLCILLIAKLIQRSQDRPLIKTLFRAETIQRSQDRPLIKTLFRAETIQRSQDPPLIKTLFRAETIKTLFRAETIQKSQDKALIKSLLKVEPNIRSHKALIKLLLRVETIQRSHDRALIGAKR